jgi:hypothetical protein
MNVTVFTRHSADCPKKSDKYWTRSKCSKWLSVSDDRGFTRQSAKTRSWEEAERKAKTMDAAAETQVHVFLPIPGPGRRRHADATSPSA